MCGGVEASDQHAVAKATWSRVTGGKGGGQKGTVGWRTRGGLCCVEVLPTALQRELRGLKSMCC